MSQSDDFLGGLHFDSPRDLQQRVPRPRASQYRTTTQAAVEPAVEPLVEPAVGPEVEPAARPAARVKRRVSPWWHVAGFLLGALGAVNAAVLWGYGLDQLDEVRLRGLVALGLAGLLMGLVCLGKLSPAAPLIAGLGALAASVLFELKTFEFLPVLRPVFESGVPVLVGVLLVLLALRRR
ncbi:hypothetical protein ALI22I_39525 [Saccharothrix sp. ALI-22-I]|nr:hypothetical protein ALI22I_39525 [Saccharothrix sp. ALI-22-I]